MEEVMLRIDNVSKRYRLGQIGGTTLRDELQRWNAKRKGKEDPTRKIGAKNYNQGETFMALKGISFDVMKGERIGIIGHNGAGKSTLLKLISRVTAPSGGRICLNGRVASMLEVGTGFHPELTGRENVYMNGAILGMTKAEIDGKMENIIDFSEVRQFIDTPVKRYSSGMYVKLAFSVAAHLDSEIMIMDEVLAVGDVSFQEKCLGKMGDVSREEGRTILYVSHNMNTIRRLCTKCIVLSSGNIVFNGNTEEAISAYLNASELSKNYIVLEKNSRPNTFKDTTVTIHSIAMDTDSSVFHNSDFLKGELQVYSQKTINNVRLELVLRSAAGVPVTRYFSDPSIVLYENQMTPIRFSIDISRVVSGKYTLTPILREVNSWGAFRNLDGISNVYLFEIEQTAHTICGGTEWNTFYSGYFLSPPINILK